MDTLSLYKKKKLFCEYNINKNETFFEPLNALKCNLKLDGEGEDKYKLMAKFQIDSIEGMS